MSGQRTSFTTEIAAGDFILVTVGGLPYTLPVKSVGKQYAVDAGQQFYRTDTGWRSPVCYPRVALNMVTAALVAQSTEALRGNELRQTELAAAFSGTGDVTVKLPDGSSFTGPAWGLPRH